MDGLVDSSKFVAPASPTDFAPWKNNVLQGIVVGGVLGGALSCFLTDRQGELPQKAQSAEKLLALYPHAMADGCMRAALLEPVQLFMQVDECATREFLQSLDKLVAIFIRLREGARQPSKVSEALQTRRSASNRLLSLVRKTRQKLPLAVCDVEEDIETIKKAMEGLVHNCLQQSNLNMMESM